MKQQTPSLENETVKTAIYWVDEMSRRGMKKARQLKLPASWVGIARSETLPQSTFYMFQSEILNPRLTAIIEKCNRASGKVGKHANFTSSFLYLLNGCDLSWNFNDRKINFIVNDFVFAVMNFFETCFFSRLRKQKNRRRHIFQGKDEDFLAFLATRKIYEHSIS